MDQRLVDARFDKLEQKNHAFFDNILNELQEIKTNNTKLNNRVSLLVEIILGLLGMSLGSLVTCYFM